MTSLSFASTPQRAIWETIAHGTAQTSSDDHRALRGNGVTLMFQQSLHMTGTGLMILTGIPHHAHDEASMMMMLVTESEAG